ncbi:MAG TPA: sugar transferase [Mobilitalea sp.]|nr:sugar transferase [Mobilitalea sp.]
MQTDSLINHNSGYYGADTFDIGNVLVDEKYDYSDIEININKHRTYFIIKRIIDVLLSCIALVILSPVFLLTAIAIRLESKGNIIFTQMRTGKDGKVFKMYKFRSMCDGAEQMREKLLSQNEMDGPVFKISNDPRVTKVGRFIRKTSIDELPQLINIIKGDMSIVGPRPLVTYETDQFSDYHNRRHMVRPGLTCYWQISGRNDIPFDEWMALDLKYLEDIGFWTDIKILLKTFIVVVTGKGAY